MVGIDIVKISRIQRLEDRFGNKALERFLDKDEIVLAKSSNTKAGFWAAKEAVSKALGLGIGEDCSFFDIKIHKDLKNAPYFTLSKHLVEMFSITDTSLSITHDDGYAIAVVVIESKKKGQNSLFHTR
jgi:holo-[acyl-carrier protein] synthase